MVIAVWFVLIVSGDRPVEVQFSSQATCEQARPAIVRSLAARVLGGPQHAEKMVTPCLYK